MENVLSSLTIRKILEEIEPKIKGKYLGKVQQLNKGIYRFRFSPGSTDLIIEPGKRINITKYRMQAPKKPSQASMILRKHLPNTKLKEIHQVGFDRVVEMNFTNGKAVVVELFGDGNLILLDEDRKIIYAHRRGSWKDRELKKGKEYSYPPSDIKNPFEVDLETFKESLEDQKIVVNLAINLGLGGSFAEEICSFAGVDKKKKDLNEDEIESIYSAMKNRIESDKKPVKQNGEIRPFAFEGEVEEHYDSLNQAVDENYSEKIEKQTENGELERLKKRLHHQKEAIQRFEKNIGKAREKGDLIYKNYDKVSKAIELFKKGKKEELEELGVTIEDGKLVMDLE